MKNSLTRTLCTVVFVVSAASAWAQYPTIPAAEKARGERQLKGVLTFLGQVNLPT